MRRALLLLLSLAVLAACGGRETLDQPGRAGFRKSPVSIRGWIAEIDLGFKQPETFAVTGMDSSIPPQQRELFEETYISIENVNYASGGVADDGSFVVLDAPPGTLVLNMQAPGVPLVQMKLENVPPNADVLIPAIKLYPDRYELTAPDRITIRVPSQGTERKKLPAQAIVGGVKVDVWEVPLREMIDRRDWPSPE